MGSRRRKSYFDPRFGNERKNFARKEARIHLAEIAFKQGFGDIDTEALEHKRQLENELAKIKNSTKLRKPHEKPKLERSSLDSVNLRMLLLTLYEYNISANCPDFSA